MSTVLLIVLKLIVLVCLLVDVDILGSRCVVYVLKHTIYPFANYRRFPSVAYGYLRLRNYGHDNNFAILARHITFAIIGHQEPPGLQHLGSFRLACLSGFQPCVPTIHRRFWGVDVLSFMGRNMVLRGQSTRSLGVQDLRLDYRLDCI